MNRLDISACPTVTSERAGVSHVHVEAIEAESFVRVEGGRVVAFDVQKDGSEAAITQVMHARESQHSAEAASLRRGSIPTTYTSPSSGSSPSGACTLVQ